MHIHNLRSMDNGKIHCFQIIGKRIQNFLNGAFNANKKNFGSAFLTGFQSSGDKKVLHCGRVIGAYLVWNEIFYILEQPFQSP